MPCGRVFGVLMEIRMQYRVLVRSDAVEFSQSSQGQEMLFYLMIMLRVRSRKGENG